MNSNTLKPYHNKDGTLNYARASKSWGISQSDLFFYFNSDFNHIDPSTLISGVFVCYRPVSSKQSIFYAPWKKMTCNHSRDDLVLMQGLISKPHDYPDWANHEYFIMNSTGKILFTNIKLNQNMDENGIIHITSPEKGLDIVTYVTDRRQYDYKIHFCYGNNINQLNEHIKLLIDKKYIKTPKHFRKGFKETEEHSLQSQMY